MRNFWLLGPEPSNYDFCVSCDRYFSGTDRAENQVTVEVKTRKGKTRWAVVGRVCPGCGGFSANWVQHFAGFPTELPRRAILAATSEHGACVACGAPWRRCVNRTKVLAAGWADHSSDMTEGNRQKFGLNGRTLAKVACTETIGWEPTCRCQTTEVEPCIVLDIFLGSGTTSLAAKHLGRRSVGIELSPSYAALARHRIARDVPRWARPQKPARTPRRAVKPAAPAQMPLLEVVG